LRAFVITVQSMSGRFSGEREKREIKHRDQLKEELGRFWINARPRP